MSTGQDVRDVCPNRTSARAKRRRQGKSDVLDAERIAKEILADPSLPIAFKRAPGDMGPDETHELMSLWHKQKRSIVRQRQHLLNESETLLSELPEALRAQLPTTSEVRPRFRVLVELDKLDLGPAAALRVELLADHWRAINDLDAKQRVATKNLKSLLSRAGLSLSELCGIDTVTAAELMVEVGDPAGSRKLASPDSTGRLQCRRVRGKAGAPEKTSLQPRG